jgi:hypothetical protein
LWLLAMATQLPVAGALWLAARLLNLSEPFSPSIVDLVRWRSGDESTQERWVMGMDALVLILVAAGAAGLLVAAALVLVVALFVMRRKGPSADSDREPGKWGHAPPLGSEWRGYAVPPFMRGRTVTRDDFTLPLEQELRLRGMPFERRELLVFAADVWPLVEADDLDPGKWAREFLASRGRDGGPGQ